MSTRKKAASTSQIFSSRKDSQTLTSERLAQDLAAFRKAGGRIEVLGVTQVLKNIDPAPAAPAVAVQGRKRR